MYDSQPTSISLRAMKERHAQLKYVIENVPLSDTTRAVMEKLVRQIEDKLSLTEKPD